MFTAQGINLGLKLSYDEVDSRAINILDYSIKKKILLNTELSDEF